MDGAQTKQSLHENADLNAVKFVELKTNKIDQYERRNYTFKKKLLRWWCQSFLVGVENIICGLRTDHGKILKLTNLQISDLPKMSKVKVIIFHNYLLKTNTYIFP